ncbi:MAG: DUF5668 domain-containing protein [Bauldia sp.]
MTDNSPGPGDWRNERDREGGERHGHGWGGPWIGGVILIVIGVIFLLQNFGWQMPKNWWAAFILIPAVGSLMAARRTYEANGGQLTGAVIGPAVAGVLFVVMAVALFLGIDWGAFWPIILILIGGGIMARTMWRR